MGKAQAENSSLPERVIAWDPNYARAHLWDYLGGGGGRDNAKWNAGLKQLKNSKTEDGIERTKNMKM